MVFLYEVCTKSAFLMGSVWSMEVNEHPLLYLLQWCNGLNIAADRKYID
jgi:hypothetical protein